MAILHLLLLSACVCSLGQVIQEVGPGHQLRPVSVLPSTLSSAARHGPVLVIHSPRPREVIASGGIRLVLFVVEPSGRQRLPVGHICVQVGAEPHILQNSCVDFGPELQEPVVSVNFRSDVVTQGPHPLAVSLATAAGATLTARLDSVSVFYTTARGRLLWKPPAALAGSTPVTLPVPPPLRELLLAHSSPTASVEKKRFAFATLIYTDSFLPGVIALHQSLRETKTKRVLLILTGCPDMATGAPALSPSTMMRLELLPGAVVVPVPAAACAFAPGSQLAYLGSGIWAKLHLWAMDRYDKVVYLDADFVVTQNIDDLFEVPGEVAGAAHCAATYNSGYFSGGLLVLEPSHATLDEMIAFLRTHSDRFGYGEQDFLNVFFDKRKVILPHTFGCVSDKLSLYEQAAKSCHVVHFQSCWVGWKPWHDTNNLRVPGEEGSNAQLRSCARELDQAFYDARAHWQGVYDRAAMDGSSGISRSSSSGSHGGDHRQRRFPFPTFAYNLSIAKDGVSANLTGNQACTFAFRGHIGGRDVTYCHSAGVGAVELVRGLCGSEAYAFACFTDLEVGYQLLEKSLKHLNRVGLQLNDGGSSASLLEDYLTGPDTTVEVPVSVIAEGEKKETTTWPCQVNILAPLKTAFHYCDQWGWPRPSTKCGELVDGFVATSSRALARRPHLLDKVLIGDWQAAAVSGPAPDRHLLLVPATTTTPASHGSFGGGSADRRVVLFPTANPAASLVTFCRRWWRPRRQASEAKGLGETSTAPSASDMPLWALSHCQVDVVYRVEAALRRRKAVAAAAVKAAVSRGGRAQRPAVSVLVAIVSAPLNRERRDAVRASWKSSLVDEGADSSLMEQVQVLFFVGRQPELDDGMHDASVAGLQRESAANANDMVILDHLDESYFNLTLKTLEVLSFANKQKSRNFSYVAKCDDDTFLDLQALVSELALLEDPMLYLGKFWRHSPVVSAPRSAHYMLDQQLRSPQHLPYADGAAFVLGKQLVEVLARRHRQNELQLLRNEDVAIASWVSSINGAHPTPSSRFVILKWLSFGARGGRVHVEGNTKLCCGPSTIALSPLDPDVMVKMHQARLSNHLHCAMQPFRLGLNQGKAIQVVNGADAKFMMAAVGRTAGASVVVSSLQADLLSRWTFDEESNMLFLAGSELVLSIQDEQVTACLESDSGRQGPTKLEQRPRPRVLIDIPRLESDPRSKAQRWTIDSYGRLISVYCETAVSTSTSKLREGLPFALDLHHKDVLVVDSAVAWHWQVVQAFGEQSRQ